MPKGKHKDAIGEAAESDVSATPKLAIRISRIKIEKLLGQYDYDLTSNGSELGRTPILYGENGVGKTTLLKLLFHLLSPAPNRGHRTQLSKIKFDTVEVELSNQILVSAARQKGAQAGAIRLSVIRKNGTGISLLGAWNWTPGGNRVVVDSDDFIRAITAETLLEHHHKFDPSEDINEWLEVWKKSQDPLESEKAFLSALKENVPPLFFLTSDRILLSDATEPRYAVSRTEFDSSRPEELLSKGREAAILASVSETSRRLSRIAVQATRVSSRSMHSFYLGLLKRVVTRKPTKRSHSASSTHMLVEKLEDLSEEYQRFSVYGLSPKIDANSVVKLLDTAASKEKAVTEEIVRNYIESLDKQAVSLRLAYTAINTLISTLNKFLYNKLAKFLLGEGLQIANSSGEKLQPQDLSSGEQQLLLLFCHITTAHDTGGIFIVDEPEISLNIKWQRNLVDALLTLDRASNLQFLLASHSIELITRHRESVIVLRE